VRPDVALKQPRSGESLSTKFTFARESMSPYVHLEGTQRRVLLITIFAVKLSFALTQTVELFVF
jgi:hypothetical protein